MNEGSYVEVFNIVWPAKQKIPKGKMCLCPELDLYSAEKEQKKSAIWPLPDKLTIYNPSPAMLYQCTANQNDRAFTFKVNARVNKPRSLYSYLYKKTGLTPITLDWKVFVPSLIPEEGNITGYSVAFSVNDNRKVGVRITIPDTANRSSGVGYHCKCDRAIIDDFISISSGRSRKNIDCVTSHHGHVFKRGDVIYCEDYNYDRFGFDGNSIWFFTSLKALQRMGVPSACFWNAKVKKEEGNA